jgi:adenylyl-sulfate kinase
MGTKVFNLDRGVGCPSARIEVKKVAVRNLTWHGPSVAAGDRRALLRQTGCVVWLTGLSASGKSTIARALEARLVSEGHAAYVLDGDNLRHGLNSDLGFSPEDRDENIRRAGEVAGLLADAGLIAIAAFISPYSSARARARRATGGAPFFEVFLDVPIEVCRRRDPKGLYAKAKAGTLAQFTGVDAPYERPLSPEIVLDAAGKSVPQCVEIIHTVLGDVLKPSGKTFLTSIHAQAHARRGSRPKAARTKKEPQRKRRK